jgi:cytochrome c oxidase assembly protein subunit 11
MRGKSPNGRMALGLAAVVAVMVSLSFAAVPFYDWFCRVTGFGGATGVADAPTGVSDREVTVRFDANTASDMPWEFRPLERTMQVRLGEGGLAFFEAYNPTDETIAGRASYNVAPYSAGGYFAKVACFCFELQVLGPGERVEMPVSFFVDPEMLGDDEARHAGTITLSYTMHRTEMPAERLAAGPSAGEETIEQ